MKHLLLMNNAVTSAMVRKEEFQGEPHYMIASATMPDDIVMNGILYPAEEIARSYMQLEEAKAPVGHPERDGEFISANLTYSDRNFGIGAQVANVRRENGRVFHDTAINIEVANQSDRGKRVLDRVEAIMNGDSSNPIHTSTGIYLDRQDLDIPMTNAMGQEYKSIGSNLFFDHNAILLDEEGAATPEQGTGMAVNKSGDQVNVLVHNVDEGEVVATQDGDIIDELYEFKSAVREAIKSTHFAGDNNYCYIVELHEGYVVLENYVEGEGDTLYKVPYMVDGENITAGTPQKIKRNIVYTAINSMKTFMKSMGFASNNHDAYNGDTNNQTTDEVDEMTPEEKAAIAADITKEVVANLKQPIADAVASAVKPVSDMVTEIQANSKAAEQAEKETLITKSGLPEAVAKTMDVNALKAVIEQKESLETGEYGERVGSDLQGNKDKRFSLTDMGAPE